MSRPLAPVLAAALAALPVAARAEPLDLDLVRLGAPSASVNAAIAGRDPAAPLQADRDAARLAKHRFAVLSSEVALAFSSAILAPASTTGHSGFDFDLEAAYVGVHPTPGSWPTRSMIPNELFLPSFHVRKALPFSFEIGGRLIYLSQSSYYAGQVEAKWAMNEGYEVLPDVAIRAAWTQLFGQRDWNLGVGDLSLMASKRWGVNAVTSFTPYLALRYSFVNASTDVMSFEAPDGPTAPELVAKSAAFPTFREGFYRVTGGVRMTAYAVSLAAELTFLAGNTAEGKDAPADDEYPDVGTEQSIGAAFKLGFEF